MRYLSQKISVALSICGLMLLSESAIAGSLTGSEVKKVISGNSFNFKTRAGYRGTVWYGAGGTVRYKMETGYSDKGRWWVKGSRYCTKYKDRTPKTKCFGLKSAGNGKYRTNTGGTLVKR